MCDQKIQKRPQMRTLTDIDGVDVLGIAGVATRQHRYEAASRQPRRRCPLPEITNAGLLARSTMWSTTDPRCVNQAFNITGRSTPSWSIRHRLSRR